MMPGNDDQKELLRRLDILIALELDRAPADKPPSTASKVERLLRLGLKPAQAARVLGLDTRRVTAITATKKKRAAGKRQRAEAGERQDG